MNATAARIARTAARATVGLAVAGLTIATAGTAFADADAATAAQPTALHVSGSVLGNLHGASVSCAELADNSYAWSATGTVDGAPVEIYFNTNNFRGSADYNTTGISDDLGGLATLTAGTGSDVTVATNAESTGVFTVAEDGVSGTIDATLDNAPYNQQVRVSGEWSCA